MYPSDEVFGFANPLLSRDTEQTLEVVIEVKKLTRVGIPSKSARVRSHEGGA